MNIGDMNSTQEECAAVFTKNLTEILSKDTKDLKVAVVVTGFGTSCDTMMLGEPANMAKATCQIIDRFFENCPAAIPYLLLHIKARMEERMANAPDSEPTQH